MQDGSYPNQSNLGAFVGTTNVWDVSEIYNQEGISEPLKELLVRLYQNLNNMSVVLNLKDTGYYTNQEFLNGQLFFPNPTLNDSQTTATYRQVFRTTVNFGALPNTTTKTVPHNIPVIAGYSFTRIYGASSSVTYDSFIPLPYATNAANGNIELYADPVNVVITTADDYSNYNATYIVLEYIKQ